MRGARVIRTAVEWAAVLLTALGATLLLTSAAAYAGDSWVLWRQDKDTSGPRVKTQWVIEDAYTSARECKAKRELQNELMANLLDPQRPGVERAACGDRCRAAEDAASPTVLPGARQRVVVLACRHRADRAEGALGTRQKGRRFR